MKQLKYILYLFFMVTLLGEILFLCIPSLREKPPPYNTGVLESKIGWRAKENYNHEGVMYSLDRQPYEISISTDENGFRNTPKKTGAGSILIVGDSFTQSVEVSDDKTYYAYLGEALGRDVYAYGMAGYGTLQEYMILEEYMERINPVMVILQFCSNDFIDNEITLERNANYYVGLERPYLTDDLAVENQHPLNAVGQFINETNFLKFCSGKWRRIRQKLGIEKKNSSLI